MHRLTAFLMACVFYQGTAFSGDNPRLIILADMGNEADEEQQMAHMLVNCNEFGLEGLIAVTGKFLQENARTEYKRMLHPELFHKLIDGYAEVVPNLQLHADSWPTPDYLHGIVRSGQTRYGLADVGPGKSTEGSRLIARSMQLDDPRPLNIKLTKIDGRHWLVDPDGNPFFAHGITHVGNNRAKIDFTQISTACKRLGRTTWLT